MFNTKNTFYIHVLMEVVLVCALGVWFINYKKATASQIEELTTRLEEQEQKMKRLERLVQNQTIQMNQLRAQASVPQSNLFNSLNPMMNTLMNNGLSVHPQPSVQPVPQPSVQPVPQPSVQPVPQPSVQPKPITKQKKPTVPVKTKKVHFDMTLNTPETQSVISPKMEPIQIVDTNNHTKDAGDDEEDMDDDNLDELIKEELAELQEPIEELSTENGILKKKA